jgi:hypothetical protein
VSDYSYKYGMPREQVHLVRYGVNEVPPRRGMGGAQVQTIGDGIPVVPILVGVAGLVFLVWLLRR